jgi:hypothetical protein
MKYTLRMVLLGCAVLAARPSAVQAQAMVDCRRAGQAAEREFGVPDGLLQAIGQVESGRWDAFAGRTVAWPWTVDVDGAAYFYPSAGEAEQATRAFLATGRHSIDIGCFQVSLLYHPLAFAGLDEAFDPSANARYAARFLVSLKVRLGTWEAAAAAYHSADPAQGMPYLSRVLAAWTNRAAPAEPVEATYNRPVFNINVWTPSAPGTALPAVAVPGNSLRNLPNVITVR